MKKALLVLFAVAVVSSAVTLHLVRELRAERAAVAALQARLDDLLKERAAVPATQLQSPTEPETPSQAPPRASTPAPSSAPTAITGPVSARAAGIAANDERMAMLRADAERRRALMRDPEYREAMRVQHRAMLSHTYPDLAAELGLSREEADQLLTLLSDQQMQDIESREQMTPLDDAPDPATLDQYRREMESRHRARQQELEQFLGPERMRAWEEYQRGLGARHEANQLASSLAAKGAPLGEDQLRAVRQALVAEQAELLRNPPQVMRFVPNNEPPSARMMLQMQEQQLEHQRERHARLRDALASTLTSEQLELWTEEHEIQLRVQGAQLRLMRAQAEAEERGEVKAAPHFSATPGMMIEEGSFAPY